MMRWVREKIAITEGRNQTLFTHPLILQTCLSVQTNPEKLILKNASELAWPPCPRRQALLLLYFCSTTPSSEGMIMDG